MRALGRAEENKSTIKNTKAFKNNKNNEDKKQRSEM
jgi:hypothetical protein